jgi:diguanylate cyclase (GGDEF)-like protein
VVRNSVRYAVVGAVAGVAAPLGLLVFDAAGGRPIDPALLFLLLVSAAAVAVAGWFAGRREDELVRRNRALQELTDKLRALSTTDSLTGIPNRRALDERLEAELSRANRYGTPLSLVMIDLDLFKHLNDRFGHQVGDAVLARVATILEGERRLGDIVARYGGEEFVSVLTHADEAAALAWAERVRSRIAALALDVGGELARTTASFGVATARPHDETRTVLIEAADHALYDAKTAGRDRVALAHRPDALRAPAHAKRAG